MSGIAIIANPHSKLNRRDPWRRKLLSYIVGETGRLEVTNSIEELYQVAKDLKCRGVELIGINGGDGTVSQTLTAVIRAYGEQPLPRIALLKGGTMNMLASNLGVKGSPEQILYRLVESYSSGDPLRSIHLRSMQIQGQYGFLFGNGISSRFLKLFYENKTGPAGVVKLISQLIISRMIGKGLFSRVVEEAPVHLISPQREIRCNSTLVMCATVRKMPMGPVLFPKVGDGKDQFECLTITASSKDTVKQLFRTLFLTYRNQEVKGQFSFCTNQLSVSSPINRPFTLDGELLEPDESGRIDIHLGPTIEFVQP